MSATLGGEELAGKLTNASLLQSPGRAHAVQVRYTPVSALPIEKQVESALREVLGNTSGHILIFLPGAAEIRKTIEECEAHSRSRNVQLFPLHGSLSPEEQDRAITFNQARKVICSTNVAESSITIEGVEAVIDSGLARVPVQSVRSGFSQLGLEKISRSSAIQRAGRAGRTRPGIAVRLYTEEDFNRRPYHSSAEILRADFASVLLQLASAGIPHSELTWIDAPSRETITRAEELLLRLDATDARSQVTRAGREMARLPLDPRLARFVTQAAAKGAKKEACHIAAFLTSAPTRVDTQAKDIFSSDLDRILATGLSPAAQKGRAQLVRACSSRAQVFPDPHALEKAMLLAYPDRVGRRVGETVLLANGISAKLANSSAVRDEFLTAIDIDDRSDRATPLIRMASAVEPDWLLEFFPERVQAREQLQWNRNAERIEQVNSLLYEQVILDETTSIAVDRAAVEELLAAKAEEAGWERFCDAEEIAPLLRRVRFAGQHGGTFADTELLTQSTLRNRAAGLSSFAELREACRHGGFLRALQNEIDMPLLDAIAPQFVLLPSGRKARIEYSQGQPPAVSSRLQDFFGMQETPTVARGAVPLVVKLLAPNQRPLQVTTDLVSFWTNLYPQLRRELSRRYPKHSWPEDPASSGDRFRAR